MKNKVKKQESSIDWRENYLNNRRNLLEDFENSLQEVQSDGPSVGGKIAGMDFQQFSARAVFMFIVEQKQYTIEPQPTYVDIAEEKKILEEMISKAKKIFGDDYETWLANEEGMN